MQSPQNELRRTKQKLHLLQNEPAIYWLIHDVIEKCGNPTLDSEGAKMAFIADLTLKYTTYIAAHSVSELNQSEIKFY